jgi:hypothetical protein
MAGSVSGADAGVPGGSVRGGSGLLGTFWRGSIGRDTIVGAGAGGEIETGAGASAGRTAAGGGAQAEIKPAIATIASQQRDLMRGPPV